jgi:hypothetical protein
MDINNLLDKAKEICRVTYDKDLAPRLGVKPTAVSNYRKGVSLPDAVVCATLAGLTGEPLARVLGIVGEARAISREEKAVWRKLAGSVAALLLAVTMLANPQNAQAHQRVTADSGENTLYIMRNHGQNCTRAWLYALAHTVCAAFGFGSLLPYIGGFRKNKEPSKYESHCNLIHPPCWPTGIPHRLDRPLGWLAIRRTRSCVATPP